MNNTKVSVDNVFKLLSYSRWPLTVTRVDISDKIRVDSARISK